MTGHGTEEMRGIIPRAMEQIGMYKLDLERRGWTYSMEVSYVEIYNENIRDLLRTTPNDDVKHEIRKDVNGNVTLSEVTMRVLDPNDSDAVNELIATAQTHRSTASTAMNEVSSRSHAVFSLQLRAHNESQGITLKGSLSLVDLAGSERLDRSGATGSRMKETIAINKSLSALVDVFAAIGNKQSHVPYRNSKLTYLLQPALSGDGKALMLVNLSPTTESIPESICSLRFASHVNRCELGKAKRQIVAESDTAASMPSILPQSSQIKKVPRLR